MATVPFSEKLRAAIKTAATQPFLTTMAAAIKAMAGDRELHHLIAVRLSSAEDTAMAEELHRRNPHWTVKANVDIVFHVDDRQFTWKCNNLPLPVEGWATVQFGGAKDAYGRLTFFHQRSDAPDVWARFDVLHAPHERARLDQLELEKALDTIFDQTPNLNRAIEVMPAIRNWVPAEYLERLSAAAPKREKRTKTAAEIFAEALTPEAAAALARSRLFKDPSP